MMTSFYNLLKYAATGQVSPSMTYYDKIRASTLMGGMVQTLTGQPPLTFKADGTPLISWSVKGNAVQNGTPAPDNIVVPEMCGVRTGNLFDKDATTVYDAYFNESGYWLLSSDSKSIKFPCSPNTQYTLSVPNDLPVFRIYESADTGIEPTVSSVNRATTITRSANIRQYTFTTSPTAKILMFQVSNGMVEEWFNGLMLNLGSTALSFEPYGWKVPFENRGENLFDYSTLANDYTLNATTGLPYAFPKRIATLTPIDVSALSSVTLSYQSEITNTMFIYAVFNGSTLISRVASNRSGDTIDVSGGDNLYISFYSQPDNISIDKLSNIMLNPGSSPKPYSPYLNETIPVYLGEVPTVRRVRKLVLDGTENWRESSDTNIYIPLSPNNGVAWTRVLSTHFTPSQVHTNGGLLWFVNANVDFDTAEECKTYLASEYAAGHPVTVWYVSAHEQTGIVNEPLCKIGDYADELHSTDAAVTIPTVKGQNVLTVDTPIQPSEMTITVRIQENV